MLHKRTYKTLRMRVNDEILSRINEYIQCQNCFDILKPIDASPQGGRESIHCRTSWHLGPLSLHGNRLSCTAGPHVAEQGDQPPPALRLARMPRSDPALALRPCFFSGASVSLGRIDPKGAPTTRSDEKGREAIP